MLHPGSAGQDKLDGKTRPEVGGHLSTTVPQALQKPALPRIYRSLSRGALAKYDPYVSAAVFACKQKKAKLFTMVVLDED